MKLFQRITAMGLAIVVCLCALTGCGKQGAASSSGAQTEDISGAASAEATPLGTIELSTVTDISTYLCGLAPDTVVATAEGIEITAGELMYWLITNSDNVVEYYYYYQGTDQLPWTTIIGNEEEGEESKTFAEYMIDDSVKYAAMQRIVEREAKKVGIAVKPEEKQAAQTALDTLTSQLLADTDKISVEQYLWQQALTDELFIWNYTMDSLYQGLSEHYFGKGGEREPTEEILLSYLDSAGYYKVKHILLATVDTATREELDDKTKAEKKVKAEELLAQLKSSGNDQALFDKLMKEHSEDPGLAAYPEGYDFQTNTTVDPAFELAALELEPGQISEIVEGASGYHIILRLPMKVTEELKQAFISEQMSLMGTLWIEGEQIELTEAGKSLDAKAIYDAMQIYRNTIAELVKEDK